MKIPRPKSSLGLKNKGNRKLYQREPKHLKFLKNSQLAMGNYLSQQVIPTLKMKTGITDENQKNNKNKKIEDI